MTEAIGVNKGDALANLEGEFLPIAWRIVCLTPQWLGATE